MTFRSLGSLLGLAFGLAAGLAAQQAPGDSAFDHALHAKLFPTCTGCHAGAARADAPLFPSAAVCATCHDGTTKPRVTFVPPPAARASNLRFSHADHRTEVDRLHPDSARGIACVACHTPDGTPWMTAVRDPLPERCFNCHGIQGAHLSAPDTACSRCHVPLPEATRLAATDVAKFPEPPSHRQPGFLGAGGHGRAATSAAPVAASCATCHARDFCLECHVNAPETPAIQALAPDPRAAAIHVSLREPDTHHADDFLSTHGRASRAQGATCSTCHTRESCLTCHAATPQVAATLAAAGPGRSAGARVSRIRPAWHGKDFARTHAPSATTAAQTCASCHTRADCLSCHRPDASSASRYHPAGFLTSHPEAAYARESSCTACHNQGAFCASCHKNAGVVARTGTMRPGFHDGSPFFIAGHGAAARQSLETCTSCHAERDCLTCHSALSGRKFDPHGPGFDPNRLRQKNPEVCTACHGLAIPSR